MLLGYWLVEDLIILIHFYDIPAFFVLLWEGVLEVRAGKTRGLVVVYGD
jgi:hypothetical protein